MTLPLEELIGFLKQGDNYTQDTREWPDPTEPRASQPPLGKGCTCEQGQKLDCPIHGMHADPELVELDHTWSMPQAQPIGYQQDGPRNWTQAVSSFTPRSGDAGDTNNPANQKNQRDPSPGSSNRAFAPRSPSRWKVRDLLQSKRSARFGIGGVDVPKFDSFVVGNRQDESVKRLGNLVDMENGFVPFGILKHGAGPIVQGDEDDSHGVHSRVENRSSFGVHDSTPTVEKVFAVGPVGSDQTRERHDRTQAHAGSPEDQAKQTHTRYVQADTNAGQEVSDPEWIANKTSHKWSVTRVALKLRRYKPGKYGKGMVQSEEAPEALIWRIKGGWNGSPHHDEMQETLGIERPMIAFHIDKEGCFYFHQHDDGFTKPEHPATLADEVERQYPELKWGKISAEDYETQHPGL